MEFAGKKFRLLGFFERWLPNRAPVRRTTAPAPPAPTGWNLTLDDLFAEMKAGRRSKVGKPELDWARDYERSLLPADLRFPHKGDVYEALADMQVEFITDWAAPYSGGGEGLLHRGERVIIDSEPLDERPLGAYAVAADYKAVEARLVPAGERTAPKYGGFHFYFKTLTLNRDFRLVRGRKA